MKKKIFKSQIELIKGLELTINFKDIKANCLNFYINIPTVNGQYNTKISKRNIFVIITTVLSDNTYLQFKITKELDRMELILLPNDIIPSEIIKLLLKTYELFKLRTLKDLLNVEL